VTGKQKTEVCHLWRSSRPTKILPAVCRII